MPYVVIMYLTRKQGMSPAEFKSHYESNHVPLIVSIFGDLMPTLYSRRYIERSDEAPHDANVLIGQQTDFPYDCITELVFDNKQKLDAFNAVYYRPDIQNTIQEDEARFAQHDKLVAVKIEDVRESSRGAARK